jgi:hypothetical protein
MKRLLLPILLLASCGPTRTEEVVPRYAVLTSLPVDHPLRRFAEDLARRRYGTVVEFNRLDSALGRLRALQPSYVAVVIRPEELDANFQLSLFELSCRLDGDPFPDFAWGYFLAADAASLERQIQTVRGAEARVDRRLLRLAHLEPGAAESRASTVDLEWATRLPCRVVSVKEGDLEFLHKNHPSLMEADVLILEGEGSPEGIRGLPPGEARLLKLDNTAVFSGASYTGAAGPVFETVGDTVARRPVPHDRTFVRTILQSGAVALFAPLHRTLPGLAAFEWAGAILYDAPYGESMKRTYDLAILSSGYATPTVGRFVDGRTAPTGHDTPGFLAMTRVLYGDPLIYPPTRPAIGPVALDPPVDGEDAQGQRTRTFRVRVVSPDCAPFFTDPFSGGPQRVYLRLPCPAGTRKAFAETRTCELDGKKVRGFIESQALELWRGETILHVLMRGDDLARKDLRIELSVRLK